MNISQSVHEFMMSRNSIYLMAMLAAFAGLLILASTGCFPTPSEESTREAAVSYETCAIDGECGGEMECVDLLGSNVCVATGCAANPDVCVTGETCVTSTVSEKGVCALTGPTDICGRQCRDPMRCSLDPECVSAGCCGTVDEGGCPSVCAELESCTCVIDPRCPEVCCNM